MKDNVLAMCMMCIMKDSLCMCYEFGCRNNPRDTYLCRCDSARNHEKGKGITLRRFCFVRMRTLQFRCSIRKFAHIIQFVD